MADLLLIAQEERLVDSSGSIFNTNAHLMTLDAAAAAALGLHFTFTSRVGCANGDAEQSLFGRCTA